MTISESNRIVVLQIIEKISENQGSDEQITEWLESIERTLGVPEGYVSDLIFWPRRNGLGDSPSPEEVLEKALQYKPLSM